MNKKSLGLIANLDSSDVDGLGPEVTLAVAVAKEKAREALEDLKSRSLKPWDVIEMDHNTFGYLVGGSGRSLLIYTLSGDFKCGLEDYPLPLRKVSTIKESVTAGLKSMGAGA